MGKLSTSCGANAKSASHERWRQGVADRIAKVLQMELFRLLACGLQRWCFLAWRNAHRANVACSRSLGARLAVAVSRRSRLLLSQSFSALRITAQRSLLGARREKRATAAKVCLLLRRADSTLVAILGRNAHIRQRLALRACDVRALRRGRKSVPRLPRHWRDKRA